MTVSATPVVVASPTFSNFPATSRYANTYQTTVAGGSLWYLQSTGAGGRVDIGNVTTAGVVTNYNIQVLSGVPTLQLRSLIIGPDGNVWFNGTVGTEGYTGRLDISTGTVTVYSNYVPEPSLSGSLGNLVASSDGKLWYLVKSTTSTNYTYVVKVDPTTGANTVVRDFDI